MSGTRAGIWDRSAGSRDAVGAPAGELSEHRLQRLPGLGQLVPPGPPLSDLSHDSVLLERAQTRGEDVGADTAEPAQQLGVAARPEQQVPHDQKRPALADDVERRAGWTERLVSEGRRHLRPA